MARFTAHPSAVSEIARWYAPSGRLDMPVLTLHTRRDPVVPVRHEAAFAGGVDAAGSSGLLLQRIPDRFGHCAFPLAEKLAAVNDLATWVRSGVRPGG